MQKIFRNRVELGLVIAYAGLFLAYFLGIRFVYPVLNVIAFALLFTLVWFLTYLLLRLKVSRLAGKVSKVLGALVLFLLTVATLPLLFILSLEIYSVATDKDGANQSKLELHRTSLTGLEDVVIYQTNGGATTGFGISIYKELNLGFGFKKVTLLANFYHAYEVQVEKISNDYIILKNLSRSPKLEQFYPYDGPMLDTDSILSIHGQRSNRETKRAFTRITGLKLPMSASNIVSFSEFGWMGDGTQEISFNLSKDDMDLLLSNELWNQEWKRGPVKDGESPNIVGWPSPSPNCEDCVNYFVGAGNQIEFKNSDSLKYVIKNTTPHYSAGDQIGDYSALIIDTKNSRVLVIDSDS